MRYVGDGKENPNLPEQASTIRRSRRQGYERPEIITYDIAKEMLLDPSINHQNINQEQKSKKITCSL